MMTEEADQQRPSPTRMWRECYVAETTVWCNAFASGRSIVTDDYRTTTSIIDTNVAVVDAMIREDRRVRLPLNLKKHLRGQRSYTLDEAQQPTLSWLGNLEQDFFEKGMNDLLPRWNKC
ncbi:hypothetical protein AVEN_212608-1 [Araneus ventricosus]|uniref:Uncharacterized protein n=1 Tax=Araneus ventricosus TaxID=182803 RepID=A0A4Y2WAL3_ARAVE|nr:hypothetical protein AVEN_212608-1 [Araneus ventricosus]